MRLKKRVNAIDHMTHPTSQTLLLAQKAGELASLDSALSAMSAAAAQRRLHAVAAAFLVAFSDSRTVSATFSVTQQTLPTFPPSAMDRRVLFYSLWSRTAAGAKVPVLLPDNVVSAWSLGEGSVELTSEDPEVKLAQALMEQGQEDAALSVLAARLDAAFLAVFFAFEAVSTNSEPQTSDS